MDIKYNTEQKKYIKKLKVINVNLLNLKKVIEKNRLRLRLEANKVHSK